MIIEWENGDVDSELLSVISADDTISYSLHEKEYNFLQKSGWKRFKRLAKRGKRLLRLQNQAKLRSYRTSPG